ncbi:MAG TPA: sulfur carrier protein ThiS [Solirubrobacteraceae bacterium]|nr:sulfur carrier protein ThiS [Solirubrobacteraceae bacterium]
MIIVNGEPRELCADTTIAALIEAAGVPAGGRGMAVALDGEVVPRAEWDETALTDGARVEIVVAVQGG